MLQSYTDIPGAQAKAEQLRERGYAVSIVVRNGCYVLDVRPPIRVNIRKPVASDNGQAEQLCERRDDG